MIYRPWSALWWVMVVLAACGASSLVSTIIMLRSGSLIVGGTLVFAALVLCGAIILYCSRSVRLRREVIVVAAILGGTIATWIAMHGNRAFIFLYYVIPEHAEDWQAAIAGPFTEEWAKTIVILLVVLLAGLRDLREGFVIGAFVGLGFQTAENIVYVAYGAIEDTNSDLEGALVIAGLRFFIAISSHWVFSAYAGVGVMLLLAKQWNGAYLLLLSYLWHFLWNAPLEPSLGLWVIVAKMAIVVIAFCVFVRWVMGARGNEELDSGLAGAPAVHSRT